MTAELSTFAAWEAALTKMGFTLKQTSSQGSALFECNNTIFYRVAPFEPNAATAAWLKRTKTIDVRCAVSEEGRYGEASDLPEFGLEQSDDYHGDLTAVTKTMLAVFMSSPVEYRETYILGTMERKKPSSPIKTGLICHSMLLDHKRIDEACVAYPYSCFTDGGRIITKRAEEFDKRVHPMIAVKADMIPVIERVVASARNSDFGKLFDLHGDNMKFETRVDAEIYGLKCKCRPDIHIVLDDQIIVPDLKFGAYKPEDWRRSSSRFSYWLQMSHYTAILESHYGLPVSWSFWAGETKPPFRFGPKDYDFRSIEMAKEKHKSLILQLKDCYERDEWKDNYETTLTLAPWDLGEDYIASEIDDAETTIYAGDE